jgi:hypothetical protein
VVTPVAAGGTVGESDPVGVLPDATQPATEQSRRRWTSWRLALGLSPTPRSGLVLLIVGMALGPYGLQLLSERVLASLDPAVSVALVALGVLVGLDVKVRSPGEGRLLAVASLDAGVTILIVGTGMAFLLAASSSAADEIPWLLALLLGVCAAPSSTPTDGVDDARYRLTTRLGDLDDVLPIVLAALAIVWMRQETPVGYAWFLAQGGLLAVAVAFATQLLVTQTSSESEQRVFVIGALLLLAGAAAHLSLAAPLVGLVAGVFWSVTGGAARDRVAREVPYLQHPLTVLLFLAAGARMEFNRKLLGVAVAYAVLRMIGKLVGGWFAARVTLQLPRKFGLFLSAPGVVGIAIALNVLQARGDAGSTMFTIVIAGSLAAELFSLLVGLRQDDWS